MTQSRTDLQDTEGRLMALEARVHEYARELAELRERQALDTRFLANISHDLRTPLTAIITHGEILRDGILGELSDRQRASVVGIIKGGHQLLVRDHADYGITPAWRPHRRQARCRT